MVIFSGICVFSWLRVRRVPEGPRWGLGEFRDLGGERKRRTEPGQHKRTPIPPPLHEAMELWREYGEVQVLVRPSPHIRPIHKVPAYMSTLF